MKSEGTASSSAYVELAPPTPDMPLGGSEATQFKFDGVVKTISESDVDSDSEDLGGRIVAKFGDKTCNIKHYYDFDTPFDNYQKLISNCKFYLQKVGKKLGKKDDPDNSLSWIIPIMKNWSEIGMPENTSDTWDQITFVVWNAIMRYNCNLCLYQEYYLTNWSNGEPEDIVPQHRFKKLLEETVIKMNADASVKNDVAKKIIAQNLTQL